VPASDLSDADLVAGYAPLTVDRDTAAFYRGWLDKELRMNRCDDCGRWHHPPRAMCPRCWSWNVTPTAVSGRGTIYLLILLHQGPPAEGVDYSAGPYPVAAVDLEEQPGLRFTTTIVGAPPESLAVGQAVELAWRERNGLPFPVFQPVGASA
jgi:uncharacterized OB-fold protein